jgi:hypothetical protein
MNDEKKVEGMILMMEARRRRGDERIMRIRTGTVVGIRVHGWYTMSRRVDEYHASRYQYEFGLSCVSGLGEREGLRFRRFTMSKVFAAI